MQEIKTISTYKQGLKEKILETAMKAFGERGIKAVKMDDIASRLSISKRTLYEIYTNKEDLLFEGVKRHHEQKKAQMQQIGRTSQNVMEILLRAYRVEVEEFRKSSVQFFADLEKYPEVQAFLRAEREQTHDGFRKFMQRGIREGYFRKDVNMDLIGCMFDALGQYIMTNRLYEQYPIEAIFDNMVFVSLRGLCTKKGTEALDEATTGAGREAGR